MFRQIQAAANGDAEIAFDIVGGASDPNVDHRTYERKHLDIFGAVSITAGLILLVYSLNIAQNIGIGSLQTLELLLSSVIVLAAFLLIEYHSKAPLMPLGFLRRSSIF